MLKFSKAAGVVLSCIMNIPAVLVSRKQVEHGRSTDLINARNALLQHANIALLLGGAVPILFFGLCHAICTESGRPRDEQGRVRDDFTVPLRVAYGYFPLAIGSISANFVLNMLWTDDSVHARDIGILMPLMLLTIAAVGYKGAQCIRSQCEKPSSLLLTIAAVGYKGAQCIKSQCERPASHGSQPITLWAASGNLQHSSVQKSSTGASAPREFEI